jgi:hypothetical protein
MFLKNTASQYIHAQMNSRADGSPLTSSVAVAVKVDNGSQAAGSGTLAHVANGLWQYTPTQAETNGDVISFQFIHATGVNANVELITIPAIPYSGADPAGVTTLLSRVPGTVVTPPTVVDIRAEMDSHSTKLALLDMNLSGIPLAVWSFGTRTLTSFGSMVSDIANAVWTAVTRSLTDKASFSLTTAYDAAKTAGNATAASQAAILAALPAQPDNATISAIKLRVDTISVPTSADIADKLLNRNLAGGSDGGRTVKDALRVSRNKVEIIGNTINVYDETDTNIMWSGQLQTDAAAQPITSMDPQ